ESTAPDADDDRGQAQANSLVTEMARDRLSLNYSRTMKDKSHRATRRCYRSGVWTLRGTQTRRLDGHSLYSASHVPIRAERQAGRRRVRHPRRQLGRWPGLAEGD